MKKLLFLSLFCCYAILGYSQENVTGSYGNKDKSLLQVDTVNASSLDLNARSPRMDEQINPILFPNSYNTPDFMYRNPWGYTNEYVGLIDPDFHYSIIGSNDVWPGITSINTASFNLYYTPDRFSFSVGTDLWKYSNLNLPFNDVTFHADVAYEILPWWTVGAYGQLSLLAKNNAENGSALSTPTVPFTGFGGYSRVMFNSTFGVEGSVGRQFNPIKRKWEPTYGFGPVVVFKRKKR